MTQVRYSNHPLRQDDQSGAPSPPPRHPYHGLHHHHQPSPSWARQSSNLTITTHHHHNQAMTSLSHHHISWPPLSPPLSLPSTTLITTNATVHLIYSQPHHSPSTFTWARVFASRHELALFTLGLMDTRSSPGQRDTDQRMVQHNSRQPYELSGAREIATESHTSPWLTWASGCTLTVWEKGVREEEEHGDKKQLNMKKIHEERKRERGAED